MGQKGQLHRIPLAHTGPVLSLDWTLPATLSGSSRTRGDPMPVSSQIPTSSGWYGNMTFGQFDDLGAPNTGTHGVNAGNETESSGSGWLASGGMDRCVKV